MTLFIGLDPGFVSGAMAVMDGNGLRYVKPFADMTLTDLRDELEQVAYPGSFAVLEQVGVMPKQGISSSSKFMRHFGRLEMALTCSRILFEYVRPQVWQKALLCLSKGDKNVTKARAQQMFPNEKITHKTADAILLAVYASQHGRTS